MAISKQVLRIEEKAESRGRQANRILNGDENYDGADGARIISELAGDIAYLVGYIKALEEQKNGSKL